MKIAYITVRFPAPSETFACNDVRTLKRLGMDIKVYSQKPLLKNAMQMIEDRDINDIPIICCNFFGNILGLIYCLVNLPLLIDLLKWLFLNDFKRPSYAMKSLTLVPASFFLFHKLKTFMPDVVHLFWGHYPSLVGYLVKKKLPSTKISFFLGAYDLQMGMGISTSLAKKSDYLFTHTNANLSQIDQIGLDSKRFNVIVRGINIEDNVITRRAIEPVKRNIACVARLVEKKGVQDVLAALPVLKKQYPDVMLTIAGDGPFREFLTQEVKRLKVIDNVYFLGHIDHKMVLELLCNTQIFALFSRCTGERLPNVIKEAMLCGAIPITTPSPGIDELINNEVDGYILESGNITTFCNKVSLIFENETLRENMKRNAIEKITQQFDCRRSMHQYINIWRGNEGS